MITFLLVSVALSLAGYHASDFIPFSGEVYLRLLERINDDVRPLQMAGLALAMIVTGLAWRESLRAALVVLAMLWASSGFIFFLSFYANLNWAGQAFGWVFFAQAFMLLVVAVSTPSSQRPLATQRKAGLLISIAALLWPLTALYHHESISAIELPGTHADPTSLLTLGIVIMVFGSWRLWCLALIPLVWSAWSTLTLYVLEWAHYRALFLILICSFSVMLWYTFKPLGLPRR